MASNELIIDDDYCTAMGTYFEQQGEAMDKLIAEYISILKDVRGKGIVSGDVANALTTYISYVEKLSKQIGNISKSTKSQIDKFLARVDSEDQFLF